MNKVSVELTELDAYIEKLRVQHPKARLILLDGDLGAGKTTLVQRWIQQARPELDPRDVVSPTYNLVTHYSETCVHMDLYRVTSLEELSVLDLESFIHDEMILVFVEWPEVLLRDPGVRSYCLRNPNRVLNLEIAKPKGDDPNRRYWVRSDWT